MRTPTPQVLGDVTAAMTRAAHHGESRRQPAENDLHLDLHHHPGSTLTWTSGGWGSVLRYVTRLLFVTLLLSCVLVLVASVLLLANCRGRVREVEEAVGAVARPGQCSPLPLPAYFVCLVVVVTVFGFGCVGRKVTGLLLCVVSVVAMVIAVVVVVNQDCQQGGDGEAERVKRALAVRLQDCGLYVAANDSDNMPPAPSSPDLTHQRFQFLADDQACTHTATTVRHLCHLLPFQPPSPHGLVHHPILSGGGKGQPTEFSEGVVGQSIVRVDESQPLMHPDESKTKEELGEPFVQTGVAVSDLTMNQTEVEACARGVSRALHALCLQDTEVAFPFLLTLPVFYTLLGLALIFVKHADVKVKASDGGSSSSAAKRCSVGTNTPRACGASEGGPRRALSACLSSLCLRHALCLTCLLGGRRRCACCPTPSPSSRPSSRLRREREGERVEEEEDDEEDEEGVLDRGGGGREEVSLRVLRTSSPPEPHEELRLIDECV